MSGIARIRLKESHDGVPKQIDDVQARLAKATSGADKERYTELIRQLKAYQTEMKSYKLELPTITFAKSHVIKDTAGDLHIEFHGRAHTAGDVAVFSPQKRVVATGDMIIGFLPNIADGHPRPSPATIDSVGQLAFDHIIPGHGPIHHDRARMTQMRNYIEELTGRVEEGKKEGKPLAELQKTLTMTSIKTLQANGYGSYVAEDLNNFTVYLGTKTAGRDEIG